MTWQDDFFDEGKDYLKKYEFFILSLSFTVLGFSIQTANFNQNIISNIFEISSWIFLLFSGINALERIRGIGELYMTLSEPNDGKKGKNIHDDAQAQNTKLSKIRNKQYHLFLIGFVLIIIARGVIPIIPKILYFFKNLF